MLRKIIIGLSMLLVSAIAMAASLNINKATAEEIAQAMNGVGLVKAEAIVKDREQNGAFKTIDEVIRVQGIGIVTIDKNRDKISVE